MPERTAFVRFRKELVVRGLDKTLFDVVTCQLKAKAVTVKTGTFIDATLIASASHQDGDAKWSAHRTRKGECQPFCVSRFREQLCGSSSLDSDIGSDEAIPSEPPALARPSWRATSGGEGWR